MDYSIIDSHVHCGIQDRFPPQTLEDYRSQARGSGIGGAVVFSPVIEVYDRYDPYFEDTPEWQKKRRESNDYLLSLAPPDFEVIPYFFIWNDFAVENISPQHRGIKWHRHEEEPHYHYDDPRCAKAIEEIRKRKMPVVLEEELKFTIRFIEEWTAGVRIIIPHLGFLNGGYETLRSRGIWEQANVFADTALASPTEIMDYLNRYGYEKLMFGSDFPFGDPKSELRKIMRLPIPDEVKRAIASENLRNLLSDSNQP